MFIPLNLGDAKERKPVPHGRYDLQITEVTEAKTQEGKPQLIVSIAIDGHDADAPNVRYYLGLPSDKDDNDQRAFKLLQAARFMQLFGQSSKDGIDTEALIGARAENAELTLSEPDTQNRVFNRVVLPYLKEESVQRPAAKPPKRAA